MLGKKDKFNEIYAGMIEEAPGVAGNPTQQMAPTNTQQNPAQPQQQGQQPQGQQQQQVQVDINAAATAVVSAVAGKAKDWPTSQQILGVAAGILQKKFGVQNKTVSQANPAQQPPVQQ